MLIYRFMMWMVAGYGGKKGSIEKCSTCKGRGVQVQVQQIGPGMIQQIQSMCSDCQGQGEKFNSKDRCKNCNGHKVERKKKILEVHIDKGIQHKLFLENFCFNYLEQAFQKYTNNGLCHRYEGWAENHIPWRRRSRAWPGAWWCFNRTGFERTPCLPKARWQPHHEDEDQAGGGTLWV